ncbi:hypothetical protein PUR57_08370 [Streptomyces sp. JV176]|uniref:hypothetical protein n=1 Tax=unclassified Streptomyces TaxID=2593676 RepID=UPI002E7634CE|nr:hypothetical protein [Streptomyces sp. JV176]MEE1798686.1 hypothetical protein [Streptomyces sp. JV176]
MHAQERPRSATAGQRVQRAPARPASPVPARSASVAPTRSATPGNAQLLRLQGEVGNRAVGLALRGDPHAPSIQRMPGPPAPPPPPAPMPMPIRTGPPKGAGSAAEAEFELPREHEGIRSTVPNGMLPLKNKPLVKQVLTKYYGVNRTDIVDQIKARYAAVNGQPFVETPEMAALREGSRPGYKDSDAYIVDNGDGKAPPHWPVVPGGQVKVHKGGMEGFRLAQPGHAFTGLVRFGGQDSNGAPTEPKIVLFPTQSTGEYLRQGVAEHEQEDAANPPEILDKSQVYKKKYSEYTTHAASGAMSSHGKLSSRVEDKKKYANLVEDMEADDMQSAGMTIGFTVIKGGGSAAHKFSFVSRSSNNHTFDLVSHEEKSSLSPMKLQQLRANRATKFGHLMLKANGEGSVTKAWGEKIIASVNAAVG